MLAVLVDRAKDNDLIKPLIPNLLDDGLFILQYADDTIFMFQDDLDCARNLKNLLSIFEHLSGLKINFLKSEIIYRGQAKNRKVESTSILTCIEGEFPFKYLGLPLHNRRLRAID